MRLEPTCPSGSAWGARWKMCLVPVLLLNRVPVKVFLWKRDCGVADAEGMMHAALAMACEALRRRSRPRFYTLNLGVKKLALGRESCFEFSFSFLLGVYCSRYFSEETQVDGGKKGE